MVENLVNLRLDSKKILSNFMATLSLILGNSDSNSRLSPKLG